MYIILSYIILIVEADLDLLLGNDKDAQQRASALFLLKLKEHRRLSQVAIDDIVEEWGELFSHSVRRLSASVREKLSSNGIDVDDIDGLDQVFEDVPHPFEGLKTRFLQEKYYRQSLGLVVGILHPECTIMYFKAANVHIYQCNLM